MIQKQKNETFSQMFYLTIWFVPPSLVPITSCIRFSLLYTNTHRLSISAGLLEYHIETRWLLLLLFFSCAVCKRNEFISHILLSAWACIFFLSLTLSFSVSLGSGSGLVKKQLLIRWWVHLIGSVITWAQPYSVQSILK